MKSYYYFLIPDALAWDMPKLYDKRLPTECYTNLADVKVRYQQLREQPYNYETAFDYITGCPYARLTIGIARNNPRGPLKIVEVRRGINYLSDDFYGPRSDVNDKLLYAMARDLIEVVGVDRIRLFDDSLAMQLRSNDMHITEWRVPNDICSDLKFSRFTDKNNEHLFWIRDRQRIIETYADGTQQFRTIRNIDSGNLYVGIRSCAIRKDAVENFKRGCYVQPEHPQPGNQLDKLQIFQISEGRNECKFMPYDYAKEKLNASDYRSVYIGNMPTGYDLERCFWDFNLRSRPCAKTMHSLSVSDVVVMQRDGKEAAWYVDPVGFKDVSYLLPELHEVEAQHQKEQVQDEPER